MIDPRKNKLSFPQKQFSREFINTKGNGAEAAWRVYNLKTRNSAAVMANKNLNMPKVQREIERVMEERGITEDYLTGKLKDGLKAQVVSDYKGEVKQSDIPDLNTRHKYLDTALKLADAYPAQRFESRSFNIDVQLEQMSKQELIALFQDEIKKLKNEKLSNQQSGEEGDTPEIQGESQEPVGNNRVQHQVPGKTENISQARRTDSIRAGNKNSKNSEASDRKPVVNAGR